MRLPEHLAMIVSMVLLSSCVIGVNLSKRGESDFIFPDEFYDITSRGEFGGRFERQDGFQDQFSDDYPDEFPQQGFPQQQKPQQQNPQPQTRVPFPTPIQPGPPANIDSTPQGSAPVIPDMVLTTPSPSYLACFNSCPTTSEYNPICGTNRQLYFNQQKYDCALRCGAQVRVWRRGSCAGLFPMMRG